MSAGGSGSKRVAVWNPVSGTALEEPELREALGATVDIVETTPDDPGAGHAADAVTSGADIVVACGGDGTVRACLDALAGSPTALAVVPLGTGNLLASNLGVAAGVEGAVGIGEGPRRSIDLGRINGEAFAVMAGTGFDALMIGDADPEVKSRLGSLAYVISGARNLRTELVPTTVHVDGERWLDAPTSMVLVGNFGTITGGIDIFPDALPDDGLLEVAAVAAHTRRDWLRIGWALIAGKPAPADLVRRVRGRRIVVEHARPREYELDGEARDPALRLEIEVEPGALTLHQRADRQGAGGFAAGPAGYDASHRRPDELRDTNVTHPPTKGHTMSNHTASDVANDAKVIEDLVQTLEDGREGYARAAEKLDGSDHAQYVSMFREFSAQRDRFSAELRNLGPGESTERDGTLLGDLHRGWIALKDALTGDSAEAVLKAVTTGEDHAVSEYDKALERDLSVSLRQIVERQRGEIVEARNRVQAMADTA